MTEPINPGHHMIVLGTTESGAIMFAPADRISIHAMTANPDGSLQVTYRLGPSDAERKWMQ